MAGDVNARDLLCPLIKNARGEPRCCLGPGCGFWDRGDECCAVISITRSLRVVAEAPALHEEG